MGVRAGWIGAAAGDQSTAQDSCSPGGGGCPAQDGAGTAAAPASGPSHAACQRAHRLWRWCADSVLMLDTAAWAAPRARKRACWRQCADVALVLDATAWAMLHVRGRMCRQLPPLDDATHATLCARGLPPLKTVCRRRLRALQLAVLTMAAHCQSAHTHPAAATAWMDRLCPASCASLASHMTSILAQPSAESQKVTCQCLTGACCARTTRSHSSVTASMMQRCGCCCRV